MSFSYNRDVPNLPNPPANDVPLMKENTNSTYDILNVDLYTFGALTPGQHQQVTFPQPKAAASIPGGSPIGILHTLLDSNMNAQLWFKNAVADTQISPIFSGNTIKWGNLKIAWGRTTGSGNPITVNFGITFSNTDYTFLATSSNTDPTKNILYGTINNSASDGLVYANVTVSLTVNWLAIGF